MAMDNLHVTGWVSTQIVIDEREQKRIARVVISNLTGIVQNRDYMHFVRGDDLILSITHSTGSHSFDEETVVRKATDLDRAALRLLQELK